MLLEQIEFVDELFELALLGRGAMLAMRCAALCRRTHQLLGNSKQSYQEVWTAGSLTLAMQAGVLLEAPCPALRQYHRLFAVLRKVTWIASHGLQEAVPDVAGRRWVQVRYNTLKRTATN